MADLSVSKHGRIKKNLILSSGEDVFLHECVNSNDVTKYASQGMFIDLTELIEQYAPNVKAAFTKCRVLKISARSG